MDCHLLIFESENRIIPQISNVCVKQSDKEDVLLQKLGYSASEYWLCIVPNSSLWAGSQLVHTAQQSSEHKEIGSLLYENDRDYTLVLMSRGKEVISEETVEISVTKGNKATTPEFDSNGQHCDESSYLSYHSNLTTPTADDVIITSPPKQSIESTANSEKDVTIISESEDDSEGPLSTGSVTSKKRECALPGIFSPRIGLCPKPRKIFSSVPQTSSFVSSSSSKEPHQIKDVASPCSTAISSCDSHVHHYQRSSRDEIIVISSSDEASKLKPVRSIKQQCTDIEALTRCRRSPISSDEGIVLDQPQEGADGTDEGSILESSFDRSLSRTKCLLDLSDAVRFSDKSSEKESHGVHQQKSTGGSSVVKCCGFELSEADLKTLQPHTWLNDQVINCYMKLLTSTYGHRHKVHIVSTFFYTKLVRSGYSGVESWLKGVKLHKLRLLLVPVHLSQSHWALAAVNFRTERITYFDSLQFRATSCLKRLKVFLLKYAKAHRCRRMRRWRWCYAKDIPLQGNGNDCGVFVCQFAKWLCSRCRLNRDTRSHSDIPFQQRDIPIIRKAMLKELRTGVCTFRLF